MTRSRFLSESLGISKAGFTVLEMLISLILFGMVGYLAISTLGKSAGSFKKGLLNLSMSQSQGLTLQKLSKTGVLKQILATKISAAELANYRSCAAGSGIDCIAQFNKRVIPLTLDPADPMSKDFNGAFGRDLAGCADPAHCDKSYTRNTDLVIDCESDSRCSQSKLVLATNAVHNSDTIGRDLSRSVEISLNRSDIFTMGLSGKCSSAEGYVSEIDFATNNIKCVSATDSVVTDPSHADCAAPTAHDGYVYAGVKGTSFNPSNDCQKVVIADWSVVSGYPSVDNRYSAPLPPIVPVDPPVVGGSDEKGSTDSNPVGGALSADGKGTFILWGDEHVMRPQGHLNDMPGLSTYWTNVLNILTSNKGGRIGILRLGEGANPKWTVANAAGFVSAMKPALDSKFKFSNFDIDKGSWNDYDAVLMMSVDESKMGDPKILRDYVQAGHGLFAGEIGLGKNSAECQAMNRILALLPYQYDCSKTTENLNPDSPLFAGLNIKSIPFDNGHWVVKR